VVVVALGCAVWFLGLNAIEQRLWKGVARPPATMDHENSLSMYLCTISPVLLAATMARWWPWLRIFAGASCALAALTELMTLSRAGIPIFGLVMGGTALFCMSWRITMKKIMLLCAAGAVAAVMLLAAWEPLMRRYTDLGVADEFFDSEGFETRGSYWRTLFAILDERPLMGVGLNNWSYHVSKTYAAHVGFRYDDYDDLNSGAGARGEGDIEATYAPPAHSLVVITWGELGLIGLVLFGMIWLRWFQMGASFLRGRLNPDPMHRMGIGFLFGTVGVFLQSQTEWTYRQTALMFTFHVMMGALASLYRERGLRQAVLPEEEEEAEESVIEIETTPVAVPAARHQA
jgi:O-antigen ligase